MKEELIKIYNDTISKSLELKQDWETNKFFFSDMQKLSHNERVDNITVENLDSVSAIEKYSKLGKVCVLNMASEKKAGGGVINGARAQEECLFRCSNLGLAIKSNFYPLQLESCLYTKNALFIKDRRYNDIEPINCDVITIAALNLNKNISYKRSEYEEITKDKIRLMLYHPIKNGVDYLVLGAWGCGVFKNNPNQIAQYFKDILIEEGYSSYFKSVIFAVINDHNSVANNYEIFDKHFKK